MQRYGVFTDSGLPESLEGGMTVTIPEVAARFNLGVDTVWAHLHQIEDRWKAQGIESEVVSEYGEVHEDAIAELSEMIS